jgi:threonylcarbamoyladenosine tRNA methylthiotransferase MtaB
MGRIAQEVRGLVEAGYREVVVTGVDITGYGSDLPGSPTLGQMVRRLLMAVPELPRLRLSSLDPAEVDDDILQLIANEPRVLPHFHISAQAGDDMVLKRMKRRHLRSDIISFCDRVRAQRPDAVFGADLIAGFPTETESMFENTLRLIDDADLTYLHVFPYSIRPGTPAASMPQVNTAVIKARASLLREKGKVALLKFLNARVGTESNVLMETPGMGRCTHFAPINFDTPGEAGTIVKARIAGIADTILKGEVIA